MDNEEQPPLNNESEQEAGRANKRFTDLSEKVKTTAEERDAERANAEKSKAEAEAAKKEAEFYKGFNAVSSKYEGASEYQDKILEKVNAGYDIEDATISILAKEGKFNAPQVQRESPAGGSATTTMKGGNEKTLNEMSRDEKRAELEKWENETGGVSAVLRNGLK